MKVFLWIVVAGLAFGAETVSLMWVTWNVHSWWSFVPVMGFSDAFAVSVALSFAITVWTLAEKAIVWVNDL